MSFLTPSSPRCSLDPPGVSWVRTYRGERFRGIAGAELEGYFNHLLRIGMWGVFCFGMSRKTTQVRKKKHLFGQNVT